MTPEERIQTAIAFMENLLNQHIHTAEVAHFDDLLRILQDGKRITEPTGGMTDGSRIDPTSHSSGGENIGFAPAAPPKHFEYEFDATARTYGAAVKPYVARLDLDGGKLAREFLDGNLDRSWGKRELTVSGTYRAQAGDVIECQFGGTSKNPDRMWYFITQNGEQHSLGNGRTDSRLQTRVKRYLDGKITAQELVDTKKQ